MPGWNPLITSIKRRSRRLGEDRGQALVEFALVLPVLMLVILGIVYFGRYENYSNQETHLAEEAARFAAVDVNPSATPATQTLQSWAQSQASSELTAGSSDITTPIRVYIYYPTGSSNLVGQPIRVCVISTAQIPFLGINGLKIVQTSEMRSEQLQTIPAGTSAGWTPDTSPPAACPTAA